MSFLSKIFGDPSQKYIKDILPIIDKINNIENDFSILKNEDIKAKTLELKSRVSLGATLDSVLPEAFALVREASKRTLGLRHFDVQLMGGIVMHNGGIAEMRTGEGKTLVATLPAYLNALSGLGVHIITVNDYLSKRDVVWMGQIYDLLGLSVSVICHQKSFLYKNKTEKEINDLKDKERDQKGAFHIVDDFLVECNRVEAYNADITYGTNSEFGFDYLRDNLEYKYESVRQKEHNFAIIDEVDSILIDEARTPLIISSESSDSDLMYKKFAHIVLNFIKDEHFTVDEKMHSVFLTENGIDKAENDLGISNIYAEGGIKMVHHLETAIKAKALYIKDKEYVVRDGQIIIVDPYTGRLQPGRRWSEGLHQAIEAKEGVIIEKESKTFASITYQNYFRMYKKLSGMTGTAITSSEEFYKVYGLNTVSIPTNKTIQRKDYDDLIYQTEQGKLKALATKVKKLQEKGQPVLIGTVSIEKNELIAEYLRKQGIKFNILNAKNHEQEGEIIADAGREGAVTLATNMAGRGVDIKLGGATPTLESYEKVKSLGGLFVIGTERHDARRIDNQLRGRSGRQGDQGETQFLVSMEDHIMRVFASDAVKNMMGRLGIPEDEPIQNRIITKSLESAQEKIEGLNFDSRKHILEYDDVLNFQRKTFYERRRNILIGERDYLKRYLEQILYKKTEVERSVIFEKFALDEINLLNKLKELALQTFDLFWVEHLESMDYLRSSVNLRAYGQRDPLIEYKKEGLVLFKAMEENIENTILEDILKIEDNSLVSQRDIQKQAIKITNSDISLNTKKDYQGVGRNDSCPCGSGKKFKKCHGLN